jgi:hypothetical protein|uniref:Uncharacterized protein n=1 Tax=viral metagenome TaxID=1070528 RepID=A0A6C0DLV8_9ZZZZ
MTDIIPKSLIQICETHSDGTFQVGRRNTKVKNSVADAQDQAPKWNLMTHSISPRHPLAAWLWLKDPLFRVSPEPLRQRLMLDAITEWQERCSSLDFPRVYSKKKALEGFGAQRLDLQQAKAAMIAMERYTQDNPLLWILYNDKDKTIAFLDDKMFPREGGYKQIWIIREPSWDRLWDASSWSGGYVVSWLQAQEQAGFNVAWPMEPTTATVKVMSAEYQAMEHSAGGLSKDELRQKLGRAKAMRKLASE